MTKKRRVISRTLIKSGIDRNGDYFSDEVLQKMVDDAKERLASSISGIASNEEFNGKKLGALQGRVCDITKEHGRVACSVELLNTPAGKRILELEKAGPLSIAVGGTGKTREVEIGGRKVREWYNVTLNCVSIILEKDKVQ
jgi:hypothetical protein